MRDLDCDKPLPTPEVSSWAQLTRATLSAIRRGVDRVAQGKGLSKAKVAAGTQGSAAGATEGGRVPFWLSAIRIQKLMGYNSYSKAFRCAQRVHSDTVLNYPRSLAPSAAPKLLRCTVRAAHASMCISHISPHLSRSLQICIFSPDLHLARARVARPCAAAHSACS